MDFINALLTPFTWVVSWILKTFHSAFSWLGMDPANGWTWTLSIIGLVLVIRAAA